MNSSSSSSLCKEKMAGKETRSCQGQRALKLCKASRPAAKRGASAETAEVQARGGIHCSPDGASLRVAHAAHPHARLSAAVRSVRGPAATARMPELRLIGSLQVCKRRMVAPTFGPADRTTKVYIPQGASKLHISNEAFWRQRASRCNQGPSPSAAAAPSSENRKTAASSPPRSLPHAREAFPAATGLHRAPAPLWQRKGRSIEKGTHSAAWLPLPDMAE